MNAHGRRYFFADIRLLIKVEGILHSSAEAETEQEMFIMPIIDNLVVLAAVLDVPMDEIIIIDINRTKQISA